MVEAGANLLRASRNNVAVIAQDFRRQENVQFCCFTPHRAYVMERTSWRGFVQELRVSEAVGSRAESLKIPCLLHCLWQ